MSMAASLAALDARFGEVLGARWLATAGATARYGQSEGHHGGRPPDRVALPVSIVEVQTLVRAAGDARVPIVPYGAGTSLEGNAEACQGGLCIDLSQMNRISEIRPEDLLCVVEPGVTREQLNIELRDTGLFFPIDPGANATLGGMIATRASGTNAVRYGTMRENVLALEVVLSDGTLVRTGTRARKSSAGYDLTHLFLGSEGTLGIVVGATLKLYGTPEVVMSGTWPFATLGGAVDTVIATIQMGVPVARMELLDAAAIRACNAFVGMTLPEQPTLFIELHGSAAAVAEQHDLVAAIGNDLGGGVLEMSRDGDRRNQLWRARHNALPAARALVPGAVTWVTDICVPISELAEAIARAQRLIAAERLIAPILGHVGDGNFHVFFVLEPDDVAGFERAARVNRAMIEHALSVGGTCTGEHGIGSGKREALLAEHGAPGVALMRRLKDALDPQALFNPGKIFL